ncbi:MAG: hypothetical protein ACFFBP_01990 [Promethearchaeota archaeon]
MNIKKSLIVFGIGLIILFITILITNFSGMTTFNDVNLIYIDIYVLIGGIIVFFIALILPYIKYSYKTKNLIGTILIIGIMMQGIFFLLDIPIAMRIGRYLVNFMLIGSVIGLIIAFRDA